MGAQRAYDDFRRIAKDATERSSLTQDAPYLYRKKHHLVLIYDQKMRSFPEHEEIKYSSIYCGSAWTHSSNFTMWKKRAGSASYPIAMRDMFSPNKGFIRGELFAVKTPFMLELDDIYANGVHYNRVEVPISLPFILEGAFKSGYKYTDQKAWMYVGTKFFRDTIKKSEEGSYSLCAKVRPEETVKDMFSFRSKDIEEPLKGEAAKSKSTVLRM